MGITLLTLLIVAAGVIGYLHFSSRKEEVETPSEHLPPFNPISEVLDLSVTNNQSEIPSGVAVSAGESIGLQNNVTADISVTNKDAKIIESQITDAVTQTSKPKKKRGRKPTKKVKK